MLAGLIRQDAGDPVAQTARSSSPPGTRRPTCWPAVLSADPPAADKLAAVRGFVTRAAAAIGSQERRRRRLAVWCPWSRTGRGGRPAWTWRLLEGLGQGMRSKKRSLAGWLAKPPRASSRPPPRFARGSRRPPRPSPTSPPLRPRGPTRPGCWRSRRSSRVRPPGGGARPAVAAGAATRGGPVARRPARPVRAGAPAEALAATRAVGPPGSPGTTLSPSRPGWRHCSTRSRRGRSSRPTSSRPGSPS